MRQIAIVCAFFVVVLVAVIGLLIIFDVVSFDSGMSMMLKFGAAILLLGACSALVAFMVKSKDETEN